MFQRHACVRERIKCLVKGVGDFVKFDYQRLYRKNKDPSQVDTEKDEISVVADSEDQEIAKKSSKSRSHSNSSTGAKNEEPKSGKTKSVKHVDTNTGSQSGQDAQKSPDSRSSTSSWVEEPVSSNMDITTGHLILSYMEDHLKKKDRLDQEWSALCAYEADPCSTNAAMQKQNIGKNRYADILPYDHSRVILNDSTNSTGSDYINANTIVSLTVCRQ